MKKNQNEYTPEKASFKSYLKLFKSIKLPWLFIVLMAVTTIGTTVATLRLTHFTGDMVDAQGNVPTAQLVSFCLGYVMVSICLFLTTVFTGIANEQINLGLRKKLWQKIIYTKQSCYDADGGETLVSRVTTDCDFACKLLTSIVGMMTVLISLIIYIRQMYALNAKISNYVMLLIPASILIGWGYAKLKYLIAQKTQEMLSRTTTYLAERTKALSLVKTSNAQRAEMHTGKAYFQAQYIMEIKTGLMTAFYTSLQTLYQIAAIAIPFAVGAALVSAGTISVGNVIVLYGISGSVGAYFTNIVNSVGIARESNGALSRVINTMNLPDEQIEQGREMDEPDAHICFEEVSFGYGEEPVLKDITCRIPKHKVTAVIGTNGSGKTTLFRLINRLYEPKGGRVKFGKTEVNSYNLHAWRKTFGVVAQDSPLMQGTVRENICYGCEREVTEDELLKVAKMTRVFDFVAQLPQGFDTPVAPGGQNFSGGQRQCIAIARAMLCSPDYLLLDEATCNLDAKSEHDVVDALEELMYGRTTIVIAHSLATIRHADYVIVLRDGKVEAAGEPNQVLQASDNYLSKIIQRKAPQAG